MGLAYLEARRMRHALHFGPVIRGRRQELGLTLDVLGRKVVHRGKPLSKGYLSGIENGKTAPPTDAVVFKLARVLSIPRERLLLLAHLDKLPEELFDAYPVLRALRDENAGEAPATRSPAQAAPVPAGT
jgi:transcriptional regulator with XRE-family HTH domain